MKAFHETKQHDAARRILNASGAVRVNSCLGPQTCGEPYTVEEWVFGTTYFFVKFISNSGVRVFCEESVEVWAAYSPANVCRLLSALNSEGALL